MNKGSEFYNIIKIMMCIQQTMYSTNNEGKSAVAERLIKIKKQNL